MLLPLFSAAELAEEAGYCDGPQARDRLLAQQRAGAAQPFDFAMLRRVVESCDGLITHSHGLAQRCRALRPGLAVDVLPMGAECYDACAPEVEAGYRRRLRGWLGFPVDGILFGAFGQMTPAKRLAEIVRAFRAARPPGASLCLVGQPTDSTPPEVAALLRDPRAARAEGICVAGAGQVGYEALLLAMQSVDAALNLRRPTTGEASAVVANLLGMGVPTAVTDAGWFSELPDQVVLKMPDVADEAHAVADAMRSLAGDADLRRRLSRAARQHARDCAWQTLAEQCLTPLDRVAA
jgi:glycosyltransferase involved in cell wall biosynthesis